ncbi:MAG TPA: MarR family transcriptional regulator [Miltoncostaeaceae bacterium]|nr:MarR family transcriptional regulator [Miltoncostaeaceae bacterium]
MSDGSPAERRDSVTEAARRWEERYPGVAGFRALTALTRGYAVMVREVEGILRPLGLNLSRFEVLMMLSFTRSAGLPMTRIRDLLTVHGSSVTYLVDRLTEAGWARRSADPRDGRVSLVSITPAGREVADAAARALALADFGALRALDEGELGTIGNLLTRLRPPPEG